MRYAKLAQLEMNRRMVRLRRMHFCRVQPFALSNYSPCSCCSKALQGLAAATRKVEPRLFEPSLPVLIDLSTPRLGPRGLPSSISKRVSARCESTVRGTRVSRTMAVPDKVALGLFFFWWHGASVRALPSSYPAMPLLLHRVLTRADARCRGAQGHRNQM